MNRLVVFLCLLSSYALAKETIAPMVGERFGEVMTLEVEFIDKPDTYRAVNVVKEPWMAKVISVNKVKLQEPIVIEYTSSIKGLAKGTRYVLRGYEDVRSFGSPRGWTGLMEQFDYGLHHRLFLEDLRP